MTCEDCGKATDLITNCHCRLVVCAWCWDTKHSPLHWREIVSMLDVEVEGEQGRDGIQVCTVDSPCVIHACRVECLCPRDCMSRESSWDHWKVRI